MHLFAEFKIFTPGNTNETKTRKYSLIGRSSGLSFISCPAFVCEDRSSRSLRFFITYQRKKTPMTPGSLGPRLNKWKRCHRWNMTWYFSRRFSTVMIVERMRKTHTSITRTIRIYDKKLVGRKKILGPMFQHSIPVIMFSPHEVHRGSGMFEDCPKRISYRSGRIPYANSSEWTPSTGTCVKHFSIQPHDEYYDWVRSWSHSRSREDRFVRRIARRSERRRWSSMISDTDHFHWCAHNPHRCCVILDR